MIVGGLVMRAHIIKDCSDIDFRLFVGKIVDCDMQVLFGSNQWEKNYQIYLDDNDFEGFIVPSSAIECLDEDYLRVKEKIEYEKKNRQIRFINSWINIVVSVGPRGGVKEVMYRTLSNDKVNTIGKTRGKYYVNLLDELGIEYKKIKMS